jgi:hypothetical protein
MQRLSHQVRTGSARQLAGTYERMVLGGEFRPVFGDCAARQAVHTLQTDPHQLISSRRTTPKHIPCHSRLQSKAGLKESRAWMTCKNSRPCRWSLQKQQTSLRLLKRASAGVDEIPGLAPPPVSAHALHPARDVARRCSASGTPGTPVVCSHRRGMSPRPTDTV